jgi:hypothetical protein
MENLRKNNCNNLTCSVMTKPSNRIRIQLRIELSYWTRIRVETNADPKHTVGCNLLFCHFCHIVT